MATMEVTGINDTDLKTGKGWKKTYTVTLTGVMGEVTLTLTARSQNKDALEEIAPMDKKAQRNLTIEPVNQTLSSYPGAPGQISLIPDESEELDEEAQDEQLRKIREQLAEEKDRQDPT